jgi:hypothetical protein
MSISFTFDLSATFQRTTPSPPHVASIFPSRGEKAARFPPRGWTASEVTKKLYLTAGETTAALAPFSESAEDDAPDRRKDRFKSAAVSRKKNLNRLKNRPCRLCST